MKKNSLEKRTKLKIISTKIINHILSISPYHLNLLLKTTTQLPHKLKLYLTNYAKIVKKSNLRPITRKSTLRNQLYMLRKPVFTLAELQEVNTALRSLPELKPPDEYLDEEFEQERARSAANIEHLREKYADLVEESARSPVESLSQVVEKNGEFRQALKLIKAGRVDLALEVSMLRAKRNKFQQVELDFEEKVKILELLRSEVESLKSDFFTKIGALNNNTQSINSTTNEIRWSTSIQDPLTSSRSTKARNFHKRSNSQTIKKPRSQTSSQLRRRSSLAQAKVRQLNTAIKYQNITQK